MKENLKPCVYKLSKIVSVLSPVFTSITPVQTTDYIVRLLGVGNYACVIVLVSAASPGILHRENR